MGSKKVRYRQQGSYVALREQPPSLHSEQSPYLQIRTLGRFSVVRNQQLIPSTIWRRKTATMTLKLLLIKSPLSRDQLFEYLFPDASAATARSRLNDALHALRHALEPELARASASRYIVEEGQVLRLRLHEGDWVDFKAFEHALRAAAGADDPLPYLKAAAELYDGDLFPEESHPWCVSFRERLRTRWQRGLLRLAEEQERHGEDEECLLTLQRLIAADPIYERAVRQLMRTYWRLGEGGQALVIYHRLLEALREEVAAAPAPESRALAEAIRCGSAPPVPTGQG